MPLLSKYYNIHITQKTILPTITIVLVFIIIIIIIILFNQGFQDLGM